MIITNFVTNITNLLQRNVTLYKRTVVLRQWKTNNQRGKGGILKVLKVPGPSVSFFFTKKYENNRGRKIKGGVFFKPNTLKKFIVFRNTLEKFRVFVAKIRTADMD